MRLDLAIYDTHGKTRGYARLRLDLVQGTWTAEEDLQRAWRSAGFDNTGPLEVLDDDVVWLWDREIGNAKCNTVVLSGVAIDDIDIDQSGSGRIVTGQIGRFHGGTVRWTVIEPPASTPSPATVLPFVAGEATAAGRLVQAHAHAS